MQPLINEPALIARAQRGDKAAVTTLYEAYAPAIFRYIAYRVDFEQTAEDLTAEVFLRMIQGLPRYRDTGAPFGAWLFRIAATQVISHYRQHGRGRADELSDNQASDDTDPLTTLARQEEKEALRRALQGLPDDYQTLLILRFMQGRPHAEVAAVLGRSEAAIRVMQHRALKALGKALGTEDKVRSYLRGRGEA